jgi:uroporphyrinogen decarboxylase
VFQIGFSLWERAWTLRGFTNMMMDFYDNPRFVKELLHTIAAYNIAQLSEAMQYDIGAVYFGDDWGQQRGLQMGPDLWLEFIFPELKRMHGAVRREDRYIFIHSLMDRYRGEDGSAFREDYPLRSPCPTAVLKMFGLKLFSS